jgi:ubiquinone/menaquinone biosynthesis C-methylase UbiE
MKDYLALTKMAFDKASVTYDEQDYQNQILVWMRSVVYSIYGKYIKKDDYILELNSGTGIDAVNLAKKGIKIFATDISDKMINKLKQKADKENIGDLLSAEVLPFNKIKEINYNKFDSAVSNFGGLNCINDFTELSKNLQTKIKPGGYFIAAVMNRYCPWEILYYSLKLQFSTAFRRLHKNGINANLEDTKVKTFYFTPKEFKGQFHNEFKLIKIYTLGFLTPPPYLLNIYKYFKPIVRLLMIIDNIIKGIFPFYLFGDHFVIVLKRIYNK